MGLNKLLLKQCIDTIIVYALFIYYIKKLTTL